MADEQIVASLDIGTSKIVCLVGERDIHGHIYVIGHGVAPVEGLRRGVVTDIDKTARAIRRAVDDAQLVSGTEIDRVTVGIAGEHIKSINSNGVVAVSRTDHEVTTIDVNRAIEAARTVAIPVDREIIHVIPQVYAVDDQSEVQDPVGMTGVRLEVEAHIVTASVTSARNIYRALERCHVEVDQIVLESLALAELVMTARDSEHGCAIVDIGSELTNISLFVHGAIRHTAVVPLGGRHVTNDIAIGFKTTLDQAEALKLTYGSAFASQVDASDVISVPTVDGREARELSRHLLASIIEPRVEEILGLVGRELKKAISLDTLSGGLILVGGGALLPGTVDLAEQMFSLPTRYGQPRGIEHTPDECDSISFATAHGLLLYRYRHEPAHLRSGGVKTWIKKIEQWIGKQF